MHKPATAGGKAWAELTERTERETFSPTRAATRDRTHREKSSRRAETSWPATLFYGNRQRPQDAGSRRHYMRSVQYANMVYFDHVRTGFISRNPQEFSIPIAECRLPPHRMACTVIVGP